MLLLKVGESSQTQIYCDDPFVPPLLLSDRFFSVTVSLGSWVENFPKHGGVRRLVEIHDRSQYSY